MPTPSPVDPRPEPVEAVPPAAALVFGEQLARAAQLVDVLAGDGVEHGLIGPRERSRMWTRHVLNCAAVAEFVPAGARVVDVGSGAGLPGLVLAVARPDLRVDLVEPLQRRTRFLERAVETLSLTDRVRVVRGRAEAPETRRTAGAATVVTARAVAPLDRLASWCVPLLAPGGVLLAMKGASAPDEVAEHSARVRQLGSDPLEVLLCGQDYLDPPCTVVRIVRSRSTPQTTKGRR